MTQVFGTHRLGGEVLRGTVSTVLARFVLAGLQTAGADPDALPVIRRDDITLVALAGLPPVRLELRGEGVLMRMDYAQRSGELAVRVTLYRSVSRAGDRGLARPESCRAVSSARRR